jgi:hypothetical protein
MESQAEQILFDIKAEGSSPLTEATQDGDGGHNTGLVDIDLLEAALQSRILLNVLAVLVQGGRADAAQLAAAQHGLQQVACIHGPLHSLIAHSRSCLNVQLAQSSFQCSTP